MAGYGGTLAAVRSLGRAGVRVTVADARRFQAASWSRFAARTLRCPDAERRPEQFVEWLLDLGRKEPGQALCPTSDGMAWLLARFRSDLARHFRIDGPLLEAVDATLNKRRLEVACRGAGIASPRTWVPSDAAEVERLRPDLPFPILIKPQSQAFLAPQSKGALVAAPEALLGRYSAFRAAARHAAILAEHDAAVDRPMLQQYVSWGSEGIYGLSGFVDRTGDLFVVAASRKVLQKPRRLGVGLCFEDAPLRPELAEKLRALCRQIGYHGVFEVEFLGPAERPLLIDFNPRLYGQAAFDVDRGMDVPLLAYLAAVGDGPALLRAVADGRRSVAERSTRIYCHRARFEPFLRASRLAGGLTGEEARRWRSWLRRHRGRVTDPTLDRRDRVPGLLEGVSGLVEYFRHPRCSFREARERHEDVPSP
jgi:predicted ATP-grasp superfamily ATP-dependent carboligase